MVDRAPTRSASPADLPLDVRLRVARPVAGVVAAVAVLSLLVVLVLPGSSSVGTVASTVRTVVLATTMLAMTSSPARRASPELRELLLLCQATLGNAVVLVGIASAPDGEPHGLYFLPVAMLLCAALLRARQLVVVVAATTVAAIALLGPALGEFLAWSLLASLVAAAVGSLTSRMVAAALRAANEGQEAAERATAALELVVAAAASQAAPQGRDDVLDAVVEAAATIGGSDVAAVHLRAADGTVAAGPSRGPIELPDGQCPAIVADVLHTGTSRTTTFEEALGEPHPAGSHVTAVPLRAGGDVVGVLCSVSDAPFVDGSTDALQLLADHAGHELLLSERMGEDARDIEQLRELNAEQDAFVAIVAHELRTPVTVVDGLAVTLAEHGGRMDEERRSTLVDRLVANTTSLRGIIASLLDDARLARGEEPTWESVDLGSLVAASVERLAPLLEDHRVELEVTAGAMVRADGALLQRVVDNLLGNARQHTPPGTRVRVGVLVAEGAVTVAVADDGPGIPPELAPRLRTRFARADVPGTHHRGLGIGLALATRILELHDSELELLPTDVGRTGTRFAFRLPVDVVATRRRSLPPLFGTTALGVRAPSRPAGQLTRLGPSPRGPAGD